MSEAPAYADVEKIRAGLPGLSVIQGGRAEKRWEFRREKLADIEPSGTEWLVKHFLPAQGVGIVAGPSTVGKTFVVLYCCLRIALGKTILGHRSTRRGVLYVAAEGQNGVRKRIKAVRDKFSIKSSLFEFIGQAPDLLSPECVAALTVTAQDAASDMRADGGPGLGLVVIDTTAASMPGGNENAGEDMSVLLDNVRSISEATGTLVLLVGHTGKNEELGVRGWSGQIGNSDAIIYLTQDKEDPQLRLGTVKKLKDAESGERFAYRLQSIHMGLDGDGDAITSAYPVFEEPPGEGAPGKKAPELKAPQKLILRALRIMADDGPNEPAPALAGVRAGTRAVRRTDLRARAVLLGYAEGTDNPESAKRAFNRELAKLAASEHVRIEGELVWAIR